MRRTLLIAALISTAFGAERVYPYKGRAIHYNVTVFNPPVSAGPAPDRENQDTPLNCSILFRARMRAGDLAGASRLALDPQYIVDTYTQYRTRVGETMFQEQMAK